MATKLLSMGKDILTKRHEEYAVHGGQGERSIAAVVTAFNAVTGRDRFEPGNFRLSESEGWLFMCLLKNVRLFSAEGFHQDSAVDGVNYNALAGRISRTGVRDMSGETILPQNPDLHQVMASANMLADWAEAAGFNVVIERTPCKPLAMGNHVARVNVWPKLKQPA